jgi:hypothetical protein
MVAQVTWQLSRIGSALWLEPSPHSNAKEQDVETGLDCFWAWYFSGVAGRFTSADAPFVDQHGEDPESRNLYSYARSSLSRIVGRSGRTCLGAIE